VPPPPGVIGSLRTGFDAVAGHIGLIFAPLALDLLLWLGPRLSIRTLMQPVLDEMSRLTPTAGITANDMAGVLEMYSGFVARFNLLAVLRTLPVGITSLMSGLLPEFSPLGAPSVVQIERVGQLVGLFLVFTVLGWMLGGLFYQRVAALVMPKSASGTIPSPGRAVTQTVLHSLIWIVLLWSIGLPGLFIVFLGFSINMVLGQGLLLFAAFVALWLFVPLFITPHGIFVRKQNAFTSFLGGFRLTRLSLPSSSLFVLSVILVGAGLNMLWSVPAEDSWIALVGILGHAFITTALLASSFVYYQDMSVWLQAVIEQLRSEFPAQKA